ncbi:MAG: Maf family protein [Bacteroidota bacterium]
MQFTCPLILASGSPRRKNLLKQLGIKFTIHVSDVEEDFDPAQSSADIASAIAERKCAAISPQHPDGLTLAADTIVVHHGEVLGKPASPVEAKTMLRRLAGQQHLVYTGIALSHPASNRSVTACEETAVHFAPLSDAEIDAYVASGSPLDKAGAYGIQDDRGALFVSRIEGDFYNVVGLPLHLLYTALKTNFADLITT